MCRQDEGTTVFSDHHVVFYAHTETTEVPRTRLVILTEVQTWRVGRREREGEKKKNENQFSFAEKQAVCKISTY